MLAMRRNRPELVPREKTSEQDLWKVWVLVLGGTFWLIGCDTKDVVKTGNRDRILHRITLCLISDLYPIPVFA